MHIRRAGVRDTDTVVRILIASKEASFPDTIDDHYRGSTAARRCCHGWVDW
jgi:hypothetical protein